LGFQNNLAHFSYPYIGSDGKHSGLVKSPQHEKPAFCLKKKRPKENFV
jgi:hypothetical protein